MNYHDIEFTAASGTCYVQNHGTFNDIWFNSVGLLYYNNVVNKITFNGAGTIQHGGCTIDTVYFNSSTTASVINNASSGCTFGLVVMAGDGTVNRSNTFDKLVLAEGKSYTFQATYTQTFLTSLTSVGTCFLPINLQSGTAGSQATFSKASGTITVDFISLKDMNRIAIHI